MSVSESILGRSYPPTPTYLVGREKVREFARAVLAENPIHFDPVAAQNAGYQDVVAPSTFPIVFQEMTLAQILADPESGIDFSRVVHGEQRFSYTRPVVSGDELTAVATITSVKSLGGNSMVTASTEVTDPSGQHVVTAISTLVIRGEN